MWIVLVWTVLQPTITTRNAKISPYARPLINHLLWFSFLSVLAINNVVSMPFCQRYAVQNIGGIEVFWPDGKYTAIAVLMQYCCYCMHIDRIDELESILSRRLLFINVCWQDRRLPGTSWCSVDVVSLHCCLLWLTYYKLYTKLITNHDTFVSVLLCFIGKWM